MAGTPFLLPGTGICVGGLVLRAAGGHRDEHQRGKQRREVASCLFHNLSPFICTCSRCRFFMLEVAAKTASRYFFPKIARYRFCIRGLGVYELCLYPIKAFFDCEAPPGDVF